MSFLIRKSLPVPAQFVHVAVAGFAPSAVFQMALNSLLDGTPVTMLVGSARANEETRITRVLAGGDAAPLRVWV